MKKLEIIRIPQFHWEKRKYICIKTDTQDVRRCPKILMYPICGVIALSGYNWAYSGPRPFESPRLIREIWKVGRFGYTSVFWKRPQAFEAAAIGAAECKCLRYKQNVWNNKWAWCSAVESFCTVGDTALDSITVVKGSTKATLPIKIFPDERVAPVADRDQQIIRGVY